MNFSSPKTILQESIYCIYCKQELTDSVSSYEKKNQVHISCQWEIDHYQPIEGKFPAEIYKELQNFFKMFNIVQYRYLTNKELFKLTKLNFNDKNITYIPNSIQYFINVKELALAGNKLTSLPEELGLMKHLEMLNLSYNTFKDFPLVLQKLSFLKSFYYSGNNVSSYQEHLNIFTNLEVLDISQNNLEQLPECIIGMKSLQVLKASNNKLQRIPEYVKNLKKLRILDLAGNKIKDIPNWLDQNHYYRLNLINNPIEDIQTKLQNLNSLLLHGVVIPTKHL